MITCQEKALDEMRRGLFDVLPSGSLDALTAEDFRLLLNGVSSIIFAFQIPNSPIYTNNVPVAFLI